MKTFEPTTRREFLNTTTKTAAAVAAFSSVAPSVLAAKSPNETIGVGQIGLGTRGGDLINSIVYVPGVKVTAICDVYGPHRQKGVERSQNPDVKTYVDYREMLADKKRSPATRLTTLAAFDDVLGLELGTLSRVALRVRPAGATITAGQIEAQLAERREARAAKDFARSEALRDALTGVGVEVMDGDPLGWDWKPIR